MNRTRRRPSHKGPEHPARGTEPLPAAPPPERSGSLIRLLPEYEERYIILHKHAFPGVLARIRLSNIRNYSIFLRDGMLFSYMEYVGRDRRADMAALADETTREWWKLTDPMQEPVPRRKEGEWWASMECLFHACTPAAMSASVVRRAYLAKARPVPRAPAGGADEQARERTVRKLGVQNLSAYTLGDRCYVYYECPGGDPGTSGPDPRRVLEAHLPSARQWVWKEMKEVFHTE
jgi:L-rhamnose mutarotase